MVDASTRSRPAWLQQYELLGKIGEGTYGLVFLAQSKLPSNKGVRIAIKKFKQSKEGEGVSPTAIREIMLLRECDHENVVKLVNVHINHADMSLYLAFDYAEHDLYEIIRHHREKLNSPIHQYTVKSLLWQILNGLNYLHRNWIIHRDLKPSNILLDQLEKIVKVLGHPTPEKWPTLSNLPFWQTSRQRLQGPRSEISMLHQVVYLQQKSSAYDLLSKMLEYDPCKRISAAQALEHEYFRCEPVPGRNALVPFQPSEKLVTYPERPVGFSSDFDCSGSQPSQMVSASHPVNTSAAGSAVVSRQIPMVNMQRLPPYGLQPGMPGLTANNLSLPRGPSQQPHPQQGRRKEPVGGMQNPGHYASQPKSRRMQ